MGQPLCKSLEVPQTVKQSYHMTQQSHSYVPMRNENKFYYTDIRSNIIHNSQKVETTQVTICE